VISNGGGTRKTVMESTNATGTQTWSGNITGDGSYSRGKAGFFLFLYLEVLDASFSFDGVIGAFAITAGIGVDALREKFKDWKPK
jgi:hypothetical protein